jgi:hypothetical protein
MFSLNRLYAESILTDSSQYTFWGRGVSQGILTPFEPLKVEKRYSVHGACRERY